MPIATTTAIAIGSLATAAVGAGVNIAGQQKQVAAQKQAEKLRERQMNVEAERAKREALRNAMRERAIANAVGVTQGASFGSGVQGGFSQIGSNAGQRFGDINTNQGIGQGLFDANAKFSEGGTTAAIGTGIMKLGAAAYQSSDELGRMFQRPGDVGMGSWNATIRPPSHWGA